MLFLHETCNRKEETKKNDTHKISNSFCDRRAASSMHVSWLLSSCLWAARETPWRQARHSKREKRREKKEKSNQWTEKSRNDGTNGADLFPRCLVSSDSVCSLSTLGQLHDFPLPQNAAKTTANTSQNSQTTYKLRNDVNPRSVRLPSAVSWLLLRSLCDETKEKRWTLVINQVNASNRFIHLLIRWRTKLNKRHLIDEPSFVNPSTLSIKYPGRNQLDTHADTCTHSQKRENVTASNKKNSKTTKKHPPFWWFQHNHDHVA